MKAIICRTLIIQLCAFLLGMMIACDHEPSSESESGIKEFLTENVSGEGSDTDIPGENDSVIVTDTSDGDVDSPKDPNQGDWDPQP